MIKNITGYILDNILLNVIYGYYVKYDRLESLINRAYANSGAIELNIFINMTDIFTRIDRYLSDRNSIISNPLVITSGLINMVAHYRNFFTTRYRCNTRFWLIESVDNIISKMYCSDFTAPILSDRMTVLKSDNMEVFPMLCKLIPDVQYERCTVDFCTKVVDIIEREKTKSPNMVISKDSFDIQLANTFDLSNITVLRPIKNKEGDNSILSNEPPIPFILSIMETCKPSIYAVSSSSLYIYNRPTALPSFSMKIMSVPHLLFLSWNINLYLP